SIRSRAEVQVGASPPLGHSDAAGAASHPKGGVGRMTFKGGGEMNGGRQVMDVASRLRAALWILAAAVGVLLAPAGTASAQPPETFTEVSTFSDTFTGPDFPCQDEPYTITATGHQIVHWVHFPDTDTFHVHFSDH